MKTGKGRPGKHLIEFKIEVVPYNAPQIRGRTGCGRPAQARRLPNVLRLPRLCALGAHGQPTLSGLGTYRTSHQRWNRCSSE